MDNLKSAIADKILDLSTSGGDEMRGKLEKINRFRDFADACKSLISKYPAIESELLRMVENNDFDTKIASSRVDTIIRLSENNTSNNQNQIHHNIENDIIELEEIKEHLPSPIDVVEQSQPIREIPFSPVQQSSDPQKFLPEDVDHEEVVVEFDIEKEYADFEEVVSANNNSSSIPQNEESPIKEVETTSNKEIIRKVLWVSAVIVAIIMLIFIIRFIINNWEIILWITGGIIIIGIAGIIIKKNRNS